MAKKTRHSKAEIAAKLAQASELATQGKLQGEIARTLGVSIMTLHRWRKLPSAPQTMPAGSNSSGQIDRAPGLVDLELENSRLRRLVPDLLLEKMRLEEALRAGEPSRNASFSHRPRKWRVVMAARGEEKAPDPGPGLASTGKKSKPRRR
jgi:putative transposase